MESVDLSLSTDLTAQEAVVTVVGEVDLSSAERLRKQLEIALGGAQTVVVDVEAMSFIDSSGLNALVHAHRYAQTSGRELKVRHPTPMLLRLLQITRLESLLVIDRDGASGDARPDDSAP
jgi:anti-sigma B factor antagonist